jgi:hypothetical protein
VQGICFANFTINNTLLADFGFGIVVFEAAGCCARTYD